MIEIVPYNETYIQIKTDKGVAMELKEEFSFFVPGYRHMPKYKFTPWDGKIYLFNAHKRTIYKGLLSHVIDYFETNDYQYTIDESLIETEEISLFEAGKFCQSLDLPMDPYDYQVDAFCHAIRNNRALFLSPTSSGKSYIIYLITRFYEGRKLIIVPTKGLIKQMHTDFQQYSKGTYEGLDHEKKWKDGVISDSIVTTWQSIYKLPQEFFDQFDVIIGDEAHHFQANSLTSILENSPNCKYRFGFTGTLDGAKAHKMVLEGLFGKVYQTTTTKELMEDGKVAELSIKMINLKYPDKIRQALAKAKYQDEINYIISSKKRNNFIKNLTLSLKGNTLLLFQRVEDHGEKLYEIIKDEATNRKVFFVYGKTNVDAREEVRTVVEQEKDAIIIASYGVFSTGISIKSINNVIFASPSKSRIRNLQSIGRGLRISETKTKCTLYDISDDFKWKTWINHTLKHMQERFKIYSSEKFKIKLYNVKLK